MKKYEAKQMLMFKTILDWKFSQVEFIDYVQRYMERKINITNVNITKTKISLKYTINNPMFRGKIYSWDWKYDDERFERIDLEILKAINSYVIVKGRRLGMVEDDKK